MKNTLITFASVATLAVTANAQTITNGNFEDLTGLTGAAGVPNGWTQTNGTNGVNVLGYTTFTPAAAPNNGEGASYVEQLGTGGGSIPNAFSQNISGLTIGQVYEVSFLWGNRHFVAEGTSTYDFTVSMGGQSFSQSGTNTAAVDMTAASFQFQATSTSEDLAFQYNQQSFTGGALDDFKITAVPEPSSTALLGLGTLGLLIRRKR